MTRANPSAEDWEKAVATVYHWYPSDIFPPDSDSLGGGAGTWARKVCTNVIIEAWRIFTARIDSSAPPPEAPQ